jgi:chemotaxis protein CheZ
MDATVIADEVGLEAQLRAEFRDELRTMFAELRSFVDRRVAELSTELHATVQLVDYSEANLSGQISRIHDQIASVIAAPSIEARNSGLELEAVVQVTETAANRIMEAAEAIGDWVREGGGSAGGLDAVNDKINAIFEACSFQDLTSQRIRRAIEHLQHVESMLGNLVPAAAGIGEIPEPPVGADMPAFPGPDLGQDDIDRLLNG